MVATATASWRSAKSIRTTIRSRSQAAQPYEGEAHAHEGAYAGEVHPLDAEHHENDVGHHEDTAHHDHEAHGHDYDHSHDHHDHDPHHDHPAQGPGERADV